MTSEYEKTKADVLKALANNPNLSLVEDSIIPLIEAKAKEVEESFEDKLATEDDLTQAEELLDDAGEIAEEWQVFAMAVGHEAGFFDDKGHPTDKMPQNLKGIFADLQERHRDHNDAVREFRAPPPA